MIKLTCKCSESECEGIGEAFNGNSVEDCENCTDGRVEVVTGKYIFKAGLED